MATSSIHGSRRRRRRGFAILMVVLVLVGLAIIAAPFAISMRQEEKASTNFAARIRAKLAATGALNWAIAQLEESHEYSELFYAEHGERIPYNSPYVDAEGEFRVDLRDEALDPLETANPTGVMWGATVQDEQGKVNLKTASRPLLENLFAQLFEAGRAAALAQAIVQYRDAQDRQFTSLSQVRETPVDPPISAAEYDRMAPFLTVHSASLVGEVPSRSLALHPVNINTCTEEVLRAILRGVRLDEEQADHAGVTDAEVEALVRRLRVFRTLGAEVEPGAAAVPLDSTLGLPRFGWVSIEGDAVKYSRISGDALVVSTEPDDPPSAAIDERHPRTEGVPVSDVEARLLITDNENDLANILDAMVERGELSPESRSAVLVNAINPLDEEALDVTTSTAPLCYRSFNIYTIEGHGVVSAPDGRELARYTVRQVAQVAPAGDLEIRIDTQDDFHRSVQAGRAHHVDTWPNACQVSDIPPQTTEVAATEVFRRGRLGLQSAEYLPAAAVTFNARFNGELMSNTLHGDEGTQMPLPDPLTTVKVQPGQEGDIEPEGIHVGIRTLEDGTQEKRVLVYPARNDDDIGQSNIPHGGEYVRPFILEAWVKFDPKDAFDYGCDHFLFDLAEQTFTNRVALYYDSTGADGGDLVLHVCDATNQPLPAQVRVPITSETFEPQRWYHIAAVVKGIGYNQMALLINGRSEGQYEPSAALAGDLPAGTTTVNCDNLAEYDHSGIFAPYRWPGSDVAILGGELIEHSGADATRLSGCRRGSRGTQERKHFDGTRVEIYGYDDGIGRRHHDTEYPIDHLLRAGEEPRLVRELPAEMPTATVDDGDERQPPEPWTMTGQPDVTEDETNEFWSPAEAEYQAAALDGNAIPEDGWLPVCFSTMWVIAADTPVGDDTDRFAEAAEDESFQAFLHYTDQVPSTDAREIEEPEDGIAFLVIEDNEAAGGDNNKGEIIKYSKAGVVLVWRWHPDYEDDPDTDEDERKKICWYIGYLAGFGGDAGGGDPTTAGRRGCFGSETHDIMEGARLRLDCIKLSHNLNLPRGHREHVTWTYTGPGGETTEYDMGNLRGRGIFQLYRDPDYYEWVQFTFPQFLADEDELGLLAGKWLVGIGRAAGGTCEDVPDHGAHKGRDFAPPADQVMPVFFGTHTTSIMNNYLPIIKGAGDEVTLTDLTHQRETMVINHGSGHLFAFRSPLSRLYRYADRPRILKFPSGHLPMRPDKLMYIGSDAICHDGDTDNPFHEQDEGRHPLDDPPEPERPANATFDEIKIYPAGHYRTAGLWDFRKTADGSPEPDKASRWVSFSPTTDAPPISQSLQPPFYIRVGHLERISPRPPEGEFYQPFRFISNGHANWPVEGYVKIDDEGFFCRALYYNRQGRHSATMLFQPGKPKDPDGLTYALRKTDTEVFIDFDEGVDFPEQGYISFSSSWPSKSYWERFGQIATDTGQGADALWAWLREGNFILSDSGGRMSSSGGVSHQERMFYEKKEQVTVNGQKAWKLTLKHRAILDSSLREAKYVDEDSPPSWYYGGMTGPGGASVSVFPVEFLVLRRGCLGTQRTNHAIGTIAMPLEHIPTSLAPRPFVKLQRDLETGELLRDPDDPSFLRALPDDHAEFDIAQPQYEYGLVVEDRDNFPKEGYVQVGDEILAYIQEKQNPDDPDPDAPRLWNARVQLWDAAQGAMVWKVAPVLTGLKHFRQRFGTARAAYLAPDHDSPLRSLDPGLPAGEPGDPDYITQPTPPYWEEHERHIVRAREFRYHDRYPQAEPAEPDADPATYVGRYAPHARDQELGYYEFAITLPGALWRRVQWSEALYRKEGSSWVLSRSPLGEDDPFDVKVLVQIDGAPGWDDMTLDPTLSPQRPVATPVHWTDFPDRTDAYDPDAGSHRPFKPVLFLFDEAYDPEGSGDRPGNYINPRRDGASLLPRGQLGDRIRLRVLFQYRNDDFPAPDYNVPWRTPWVDTIILNYQAPTTVMEHREMPY
ncbi:MAG: hypothetical protein ACLF0G_02555 [Candidatus Brocadiia bacterium]